MVDMIEIDGLLVSREKEMQGLAPVKIGFGFPITDDSLRSLAIYAYALAKGEEEMRLSGSEPEEG